MATCPTIVVVELASKQQIVINGSDFDPSIHKHVSEGHEDAPRATSAPRGEAIVSPFSTGTRTAKKRKRMVR